MATLCIDAGTTVIKGVLFGHGGAAVGAARRDAVTLRPEAGHSEQDMAAVWAATAAVIAELAAIPGAAIEAIAITGQGDGAWLIDADGVPTGPAILWNDGRAGMLVEAWQEAGAVEADFAICSGRTFAGAPHAILAWLAAHDPERIARSATLLSCTGWLHFRLTGRRVMDRSDAALPFLRADGHAVRDDVWDRFGITDAARLLPQVIADGARAVPITPAAARDLGLDASVRVVIAPYDIGCMALGVGATEPGQACVILGTTICVETVLDTPDNAGAAIGITIPLFDRTLRAFPTLAGCEVLDRMAILVGSASVAEFEALARTSSAGANGLLLLPYLSPAGERAPFFDAEACGVLHGLQLTHDRSDIARTTFEALALVVADCLSVAPVAVDEIMVCGGGARSDLLCQSIADMTGCGVVRPRHQEIGARGALVAARAVLEHRDIGAVAAEVTTESDRFAPNHAVREHHRRQLHRLRTLRTACARTSMVDGRSEKAE